SCALSLPSCRHARGLASFPTRRSSDLSWGTTALGYSRPEFLSLQLIAVLFFGLTIPVAALWADRFGRRRTMIAVSVAIGLFGLVLAPMFGSGSTWEVAIFLCVGLALMGMT